jgi:hypothetical protein
VRMAKFQSLPDSSRSWICRTKVDIEFSAAGGGQATLPGHQNALLFVVPQGLSRRVLPPRSAKLTLCNVRYFPVKPTRCVVHGASPPSTPAGGSSSRRQREPEGRSPAQSAAKPARKRRARQGGLRVGAGGRCNKTKIALTPTPTLTLTLTLTLTPTPTLDSAARPPPLHPCSNPLPTPSPGRQFAG